MRRIEEVLEQVWYIVSAVYPTVSPLHFLGPSQALEAERAHLSLAFFTVRCCHVPWSDSET